MYNIPISSPDPGPDGRPGTTDDPGTVVTYYDYPAEYAAASFQQPMLINDARSNQSYRSIEAAASKRLSNRWQFMGSYSATKSRIPYVQNTSGVGDFIVPGLAVFLTTYDPNAEIFAANHTWEWLGRASGSYTFPKAVLVSAHFENRSGIPFARRCRRQGAGRSRRSACASSQSASDARRASTCSISGWKSRSGSAPVRSSRSD